MVSKTLADLQADLQAANREREVLRSKTRKLTEEIEPFLIEAEAERRANPSPDGEAQGIGIEEVLDPNDV